MIWDDLWKNLRDIENLQMNFVKQSEKARYPEGLGKTHLLHQKDRYAKDKRKLNPLIHHFAFKRKKLKVLYKKISKRLKAQEDFHAKP